MIAMCAAEAEAAPISVEELQEVENKDIPLENRTLHKAPHMAALVYTAFIAGLCSIIYELLIATTASYFLGDSVKYFSLTIGIYMASMGIGSFVMAEGKMGKTAWQQMPPDSQMIKYSQC
jgi:hypothetical protein